MEQTVIQKLISDIIEIDNRKLDITNKGIIVMLENSIVKERGQIIEAFEEGVKYGNSPFQTFDYPASRYYGFTYET